MLHQSLIEAHKLFVDLRYILSLAEFSSYF
jgi:hypothetical protein